MHRFLIIQTAFIGDVVLATALVEKLHRHFPDAEIDFLLRKGNESLLEAHPHIRKVHVWNKKENKLRNLLALAFRIRRCRYTCVVNVHRFASSGFLTWFSGAPQKRGFKNNPFSWAYTKKVVHLFSKPTDNHFIHETERNQWLIADLTDAEPALPKLYPGAYESTAITLFQHGKYICIAPSSVWATKRFPIQHWAALINLLPSNLNIFLLGAKEDSGLAEELMSLCQRKNVENLCGRLSMMQSAVLMRDAEMNYANDSGPVHFASALNAPMTAVFCSTHACYGFGPLSVRSRLVEVQGLYCKPCGLHGYNACPEKHFRCAHDLNLNELLWWISPMT
ncbi:MAG: glycosyltransferase family 9 protein [Bacteroidetes bacterium]|nr:glycosyltransferase family 9 protein [Bacteroidota bacterium]MBS1630318.1 glycosyltransferase family 9 protein [Bacteroidota bacterium]